LATLAQAMSRTSAVVASSIRNVGRADAVSASSSRSTCAA
jgi:hypothetical protein